LLFQEPWIQCDPSGKPTSAGFSLRPDEKGVSADLERLTTHQKAIVDPKRFRLFGLQVAKVRSLMLVCWPDPIPENTAHCQFGLSENAPQAYQDPTLIGKVKFNRTMQRALRDAAVAVTVQGP
jgi:hypothetical protein